MPIAALALALLQRAPQPRGFGALFQSTGFVGPLMLLLGAIAFVLAFLRWRELRPGRLAPEPLQQGLELALRDGKLDAGLSQAVESDTCLGEVVAAGLHLRAGGLDDMLANVERTAIRESLRYSSRITNIARLGVVIVLVGLLGTVMGLVNAMAVLEVLASPTVSDFVSGIGESLTCTVAGLAIALFCFIAYFALESRLVQRTLAVREIAEELMRSAAARPVA